MKNKGSFLFVFLCVFFTYGCISLHIPGNRKKRKASRKIERARQLAPELFSNDTVFIRDTIVIERTRIDTSTKIVFHDSVTVVNNDRVVLKYFYDTLRHEIHHNVECKEITKPIETRFIQEKMRTLSWFERNTFWLILLAACVFVVLLFRPGDGKK